MGVCTSYEMKILVNAEKPVDNRIVTGEYKNCRKKNHKEDKQEDLPK
jgi:hypothetical protein